MKLLPGLTLAAIVAAPSAHAGQVLTFEVKVYDLRVIGINSGGAVLPVGPNLLGAPVTFTETVEFGSGTGIRREEVFTNIQGPQMDRWVSLPVLQFTDSPFSASLLALDPGAGPGQLRFSSAEVVTHSQATTGGPELGRLAEQVFASESFGGQLPNGGSYFYLHSYRSFDFFASGPAKWYTPEQSAAFLGQHASSWYEAATVTTVDPITSAKTVQGFQYLGDYRLVSSVPEPATGTFMLVGVLGGAAARRRGAAATAPSVSSTRSDPVDRSAASVRPIISSNSTSG